MRRLRDRRPTTIFRGAELPRLMTMIVMLGVLAMLFSRAKDPATWTALAGKPAPVEESDDDATATGASQGDAAKAEAAKAEKPDPPVAGPTDEDPQEHKDSRMELDIVTDKVKMTDVDNFAYWRMIRWAQAQSMAKLQKRARKDILFTELWEHPDEHRGELIQLDLHIRRVLTYPSHDDKTPGIDHMYEAWGWTDESRSELYVVVFPELPEGMKLGSNVIEEATFVGYFLKLLAYTSGEVNKEGRGVMRASPLLVGRLIWHPRPKMLASQPDEWKWGLGIGGAVLLLVLAVQWLPQRLNRVAKREVVSRPRPATDEDIDAVPIEDWLERAEEPEPMPLLELADGHGQNGSRELNGHSGLNGHGDRNGNGSIRPLTDRLDDSKDRDG